VIDEIDPRAGAMMRAVWFDGAADRQMLLLTIHHLVVDVVSWHIVLSELAEGWRSVRAGAAPKALPEFTSYRRWSELLWDRAAAPEVTAQRGYWGDQLRGCDPALGMRHPDPARDTWSTLRASTVVAPVDVSERLLATLTRADRMREILLCAVTIVLASWRRIRTQDPSSGALIALDSHGRADALLDTDTTNTVGWFTAAFPVRLGAGSGAVDIERLEAAPALARALLDSVTAHLDEVPYDGLDYGLLRYVRRVPELRDAREPQLLFNYLGRFDLGMVTDEPWTLLGGHEIDSLPVDPEPDLPLRFALNMSLLVRGTPAGQQLVNTLLWSEALFTPADIELLTELWLRTLAALATGLEGTP
jgi:mycobactin peptide synthetase MbtF